MGLSIHYNGKFSSEASLGQMIEEIKDIAEIYNWHYTCFENEFPHGEFGSKDYNSNIYGICFTPPQCETVFFTFLSNGKMSGPDQLRFFGIDSHSPKPEYLYLLSTKTQYAGMELHKVLIHIFRYISDKYLTEFEMMDEGLYWESGDENQLEEKFRQYDQLLNSVSTALETFPLKKGETVEDYFTRILKKIRPGNYG